ncbi:MAG: precorrin-3 methylase CobJ [Alphaproteobacteria bacterium]|nr:MAG: precorrin-3 methylase CobJ [Alphaproteobacteria bacterium]
MAVKSNKQAPVAARPAVVVLSPLDLALARRVAAAVGGAVEGLATRVAGADATFDNTGEHLRRCFAGGRPIVAVMAAGALIRLLARAIVDKHAEPPVIAVSADGASVVPLLGGHHGANDLARRIAEALGGHAAVTTAGDIRFGVALDAPPPGWRLANPQDARPAMAALNAGARARLDGEAGWLAASRLPFDAAGEVVLRTTDRVAGGGQCQLVYQPVTLVLGLGCERGADAAEAIALAEQVLAEGAWSPLSLACVASIDLKADEAAVHAVADHFGVPARFFTAAELEAQAPRLANPSAVVFAETGCHGVAEGAALAASGGELVVDKRKSRRVTAALARSNWPITDPPGRSRGQLFIVGIGPGGAAWRSPEATAMIAAATDIVGYSLYLDLVADIAGGKHRHDYGLGHEEERVRHAMELGGQGRSVALVCSGDAGIYAMATLAFELTDRGDLSPAARRIAIAVAPGISALQAAAARAGAPLGHDFCAISLSDLLTPWPDIERRVRAAARGDFVIAFYNPVSKRRRSQLAWARDELLRQRPADTPVVLAANLGRDGEQVRIVRLADLRVDDVDMLTVVLVGSSQSRLVTTGDGRQWVYTPRGYAAKSAPRVAHSGDVDARDDI